MNLNTITFDEGSRRSRQRVGRGMGSKGKTCGRGHKGQHSRSGGYHKVGFEGGQMPLVRRLPKFGFTSHKATLTEEVRLDQLEALPVDVVDLEVLRHANLIKHSTKYVKVIGTGTLAKAVTLKGIKATRSAKEMIESLGGTIEG